MIPIILDTDPGVDDTFALFYALAAQRFDLLGLTTIFGNVQIDTATNNALWLLDAFGRHDVPVAQGAQRPLSGRSHRASVEVHGPHGFGNWPAQTPERGAHAMDAADFMIAQSLARPGELEVVAVGPLTNLALAAMRDPAFPTRIAKLHVMGGAFRVRGNITPHAEANIYNDPEAAAVVASAYPNLRFIGLDVTDKIPLPLTDCAALAGANPAWQDFITEISEYYTAFYASVGKTAGASLHDPATLIAVLMPELFQFETGRVQLVVEGDAAGQTLFHAGEGGVEIAAAADYDAVRREFMARVSGWLAQS